MKDLGAKCLHILLVSTAAHCGVEDYWDDDYDQTRNCREENTIKQLAKQSPSRCATVKEEKADDIGYEMDKCKEALAKKLVGVCMPLNIKKTGELLYCHGRGKTNCCFRKEECGESMTEVDEMMFNKSRTFLVNKKKYLNHLVQNLGYDSCYATKGYDASKCHRDCKELEKSTFATDCKNNDGLYKCCIRRDKESCHECRFCCTLSACTTPLGTYFQVSNNSNHSPQEVDANTGFQVDMKMWKYYDFRCLKPKKGIKSKRWPHYEMQGFRTARTADELSKVDEVKFDRHFFNLEDPKVWKRMIDAKKGPRAWRKTYGFDYVSLVEGLHGKANCTACFIDCFKAERSRWAKNCTKEGGVFKCCMISLRSDKFELVRYGLKKWGLIKDGPSKEDMVCEKSWNSGNCYMCAATHICAKKDPFTGQVTETFKTPYTTQHRIGGRFPNQGLKYFGCFAQNTCHQHGYNPIYEPLANFQKASTVEEFCNLTQKFNFTDTRNETYQASFFKECMKQKSHNVFICPNKEYHKVANKEMSFVTRILKEVEKKVTMKSKRSRRKRRCRKRNNKKCNRRSRRSRRRRKRKRSKKKAVPSTAAG